MKTTESGRAIEGIEQGEQLSRQLTAGQLGMIAIGGAIGTGLFLGSSLAVRMAGPGVIFSYLIGAGIALLFMGALSEMAVAHPTAGSFGVYAELYLNPWAGFTVRYTYWAAQCIAIGGEATAIAIYCQWWFPNTPKWLWILGFSVALLYVNARSVGSFGSFEYWFAMIKVVAIVLFIVFGVGAAGRAWDRRRRSALANFTAHGGFLPNGLARRVDGDGVRDLQLHRHGSCRGHRGRSERPRSGCAACDAEHGGTADPVLSGRHRGADRHCPVEPDSARRGRHRESVRQSVPADRRAGGGARRELRGDHGRGVQHELQSVPGEPHDVFAGARRIRSGGVWARIVDAERRWRR